MGTNGKKRAPKTYFHVNVDLKYWCWTNIL